MQSQDAVAVVVTFAGRSRSALSLAIVAALGGCATAEGVSGDDDDVRVIDAQAFVDAADLPDGGPTPDGSTVPDAAAAPDAGGPADACVASWQDLLVSPSFELGPGQGWTELPGMIIGTGAPVPADTGSFLAWLGGADLADDRLYQEVAIPADAQGLRVRGKHFISTAEFPVDVFDALTIELRDAGGGVLLEPIATFTNLDSFEAWTPFEYTATNARAGQTVRLWLRGTTDENTNTNFFVDSFALEVLRCP